VFLDIFTQPGVIYYPMSIEINVPETFLGSNSPSAKICSIQVVYTGIYSSCIQQNYINDIQNKLIVYYNRFTIF
jgi:hypothetical protein